mgnify:CR=1 FL=1
MTRFTRRRTVSLVSGMPNASRPTAGSEGLRGPRRPGELLYALQDGHQGATVGVLAVAGLAVVGLLAVWIPLSPALEATYGLTAADSATSGIFFAAAFSIGGLAAGPIAALEHLVGIPHRHVVLAYPLRDEDWGVRRFMLREPGGTVVNVLTHRPNP